MDAIIEILIFPLSTKHDYVVVSLAAALLIICCVTSHYCGVFHKVSTPINKVSKDKNYRPTVRSFQSFFSEVLPMHFQYKTAVESFTESFSDNSAYNILTNSARDGNQIKFNQWLRIIMKLLCILSTNVAIAIVFYPMQRNCKHRSELTNCVSETTVSIIGSFCTWNEASQICTDSSMNARLFIVVIILFAVILITSLTDKFMTFALTHAIVAMKHQRMSWLYYCCTSRNTHFPIEDSIHPVTMLRKDKPHEKKSNKRSNRVVPFDKASSNEDAEIDIIGTDHSVVQLDSNNSQTNAKSLTASPLCFRGSNRVIRYLCGILSRKKHPTIALPSSMTELLQAQERQLHHYGDELTALHIQTRKTTMLRAARLTIMRASMDYVSVTHETQYMLAHNRERYLWMETPDQPLRSIHCWNALWKNFRLRQLKFLDWGDPITALEFMHLTHLEHCDLIEHRLRRSRQRAGEIRAALLKLPDDDHRDRYLLQAFLVNSLCGYKRVIAQALFFGSAEIERVREDRVIWQYFALLAVPLYLIVTIGIIFYAGLSVTGPATTVCVVCIILSLVLELVYLQPTVIWLLTVWAPGTAKRDVLALHWMLQTRAQSLLGRRTGLLNSVNALVQHFHPACRAARLLPHLPIARLLLSLSDYDLPVRAVLQRLRRRQIYYPKAQVLNTGSPLVIDRCEAIYTNTYSGWRYLYNIARTCTMAVLRLLLHWLYILPIWVREVVVEVGCAALLLGLLLILCSTINSDPSGGLTAAAIAIVLLGLALAAYKAYRDDCKEKILFNRLEKQRVRYDLHCNPIAQQQPLLPQEEEGMISNNNSLLDVRNLPV